MPTLRGLRRRGYPPEAIRAFCNYIGVARTNSRHSIELLESFIRRQLNETSLAPHGRAAPAEAGDHQLARRRSRQPGRRVPRGRPTTRRTRPTASARCRSRKVLYIEQDDFMEDAPPKYFRLDARPRGAACGPPTS